MNRYRARRFGSRKDLILRLSTHSDTRTRDITMADQKGEYVNVAVLTPCFGGMVAAAYANSLLKLMPICTARGVNLTIKMHGGDGLITRARAEMVAWFLETDCTHLIFIDADIGFEPEQFFRLLDFNADLVSAAYPIKRINYERIAQAALTGKLALEQTSQTYVVGWLENETEIKAKGGFGRARYAPGGFTMVSRYAIERMCAAYPELRYRSIHDPAQERLQRRYALFDTMIDKKTGEYVPEDFAFSRRWREIGGEIWIDMRSKLDHYGPHTFRGDLSTQFVEIENAS
jgi:hypothetical protein